MTRSRPSLPTLAAALILTTCAPEYRSGETACAPTEPRCPEGFICSGIRCYLPSDLPDASTATAGTGGSAGMGGRGGAAGTGGRSADAGAMYPAYPPAAMCASIPPDDECEACQFSRCCGQVMACVGDTACRALVGCLNTCTDAACRDRCAMANPGGVQLFGTVVDCLRANCAQVCGAASPRDAGTPPPSDAAPAPPGAGSEVKFCNTLSNVDGTPANLEIQVGTVKLAASSGQCTPMPNTMCRAIAAGAHPLVWRDLDIGAELANSTATLVAGTSYVFAAQLDMMTMDAVLNRLSGSASACAAFSRADLPRTSSPASMGLKLAVSIEARARYQRWDSKDPERGASDEPHGRYQHWRSRELERAVTKAARARNQH